MQKMSRSLQDLNASATRFDALAVLLKEAEAFKWHVATVLSDTSEADPRTGSLPQWLVDCWAEALRDRSAAQVAAAKQAKSKKAEVGVEAA
jgi:hypothetical protein